MESTINFDIEQLQMKAVENVVANCNHCKKKSRLIKYEEPERYICLCCGGDNACSLKVDTSVRKEVFLNFQEENYFPVFIY